MNDLKKQDGVQPAAPKKNSNAQALIILGVFIVMFIGLVIYEVATRK